MKFIIKCETFARLATVPAFIEPNTPEEIKAQLSCVRIENIQGNIYAIATNQKIAVVEHIGMTTEPDGVAHVVIDNKLVEQCRNETPYDSSLEIITVPEIALASAKTLFGYSYTGNACIFPDQPILDTWRTWAARDAAKKSKGAMYWNVDHIASLVASCPSGKVVFPEFIDVDKPVILRDIKSDRWIGLFVGKPAPLDPLVEPATLPPWWFF